MNGGVGLKAVEGEHGRSVGGGWGSGGSPGAGGRGGVGMNGGVGLKPIEVHIDEIVVDGWGPEPHDGMQDALRRELELRLSASPADAHAGRTAAAIADAVEG